MVESDPRFSGIIHMLTADTRLLWPGGEVAVPVITLDGALATALRHACSIGTIVRGLEDARRRLADESRGLVLADRRSGAQRGSRVSRLLLVTQDGSDRFYRAVESLVRKHGPRVLAARLETDAAALGALLFGPGRIARLVMIERKVALGEVLLALAGQDGQAASGSAPDTNRS